MTKQLSLWLLSIAERIRGLNFTSELFVTALYETSYFTLAGVPVGPFLDTAIKQQDGYSNIESCNQGMHQVIITTIQADNSLTKADDFTFASCGYQARQWQELYFSQSCMFNHSHCADFRDGVLAVFRQVNDAGGIRGTTRLQMVTKDDNDNKSLAVVNNQEMMNDPSIFALSPMESASYSIPTRKASYLVNLMAIKRFERRFDAASSTSALVYATKPIPSSMIATITGDSPESPCCTKPRRLVHRPCIIL